MLATTARVIELGGGTDRTFAPWMRVLAALGLVVCERRDLLLDGAADVHEPVRHEPVQRGRRPLGARRGRIREDAPDGLPRDRPRRDGDRVEERAMVEVDV